jgi:hypothetical protein
MRRKGLLSGMAVVLAFGCSGPKASDVRPSPVAAAIPPTTAAAAPETGGMGLSTGFEEKAAAALTFIGESLRRGATHGSTTEFDADLAEARARVKAAREAVVTDSDWRAALLLTVVLSKDKERYQTMLTMGGLPDDDGVVQRTTRELYSQREICSAELRGWLGKTEATQAALLSAPCLKQAERSAEMLGMKR